MLVVNGPLRAKHNPKLCKQTKFKLSGRFLASPRPILASWLLNIQPLQMVLVAQGLRWTKHNPEICKQTKFELSGRFLSSPRPIFAFLFLNNQPLQMVFVINGPHREKNIPKICKQTKFELSGTFLASSFLHFGYWINSPSGGASIEWSPWRKTWSKNVQAA